jgi:orotidine-5'-phosphate decarboxylase
LSHWGDLVHAKVKDCSELVVGVDPDPALIASVFGEGDFDKLASLSRYVDFLLTCAADGKVGFVKFQSAYFEAFGSRGLWCLAQAIARARQLGLSPILDAKRGDIGSTATAYARAYLTPRDARGGGSDLEVDCLTVNPYLGTDTLAPFLDCAARFGKGLFVLVQTSNPGSPWLQGSPADQLSGACKVAREVARMAALTRGSSGLAAVGSVVGATFAEDGGSFRTMMPESVFLSPGVGAQGASAEHLAGLRRPDGSGLLVPVSRGITSCDDPNISEDDYGTLILTRINALKAALRWRPKR